MIKILFNIEILLYNDKNFHKLFYKEISKFKNSKIMILINICV